MRRYCTMASKIIWRWASMSCSLCHVTCFRKADTGNMARAVSQRLMLLRETWYDSESAGILKMLSCRSFSEVMRAISRWVVGSRKMKSPKPMCSSIRRCKSTFIFLEFLSMKWKPSWRARSALTVSLLSRISGTYSSRRRISRSSFRPASGSPSSTWLRRPGMACMGKRVSLMTPSVFS